MFDEETGSREGAADLKKDNWFHPRTSYESLRRFAGTLAATPEDTVKRKAREKALRDPYKRAPNKAMYWPRPSTYVQQRLDETRSWLLTHSSELPSELENEKGQLSQGRSYFEASQSDIEVGFEDDGDHVSKYESHGRYHVERLGSFAYLDTVIASLAAQYDADTAEWIRSHPTSHPVVMEALAVRGQRYQKHVEAQTTRLRWRGMEEWDAVGKADEKLREGVARKSSDSNAKPLPSLESLREQFHVEDGVLMRTRLDRPVTGTRVKVGQTKYYTSRIVFALATGQDPGSLMVIGGDATKYRGRGSVTARDDGMFDARFQIGTDVVTVGEYKSEAQAQEACRLYLKSLDMGLL